MKTPEDIINSDGSITRFKPTAYNLASQLSKYYTNIQKFTETDAKMQKLVAPMIKAGRQNEALFFTREVIPPPTVAAAEPDAAPVPTARPALPTPTLAPVGGPEAVSSPARPVLVVSPAPTPHAAPPAPMPAGTLLSNLKAPFTLAHINELAKAVELINESGRYASPRGRKGLSAIVGFAEALYLIGAVSRATCNRKKLNSYLGHLFGVEFSTNEAGTAIAEEFIKKTEGSAKTLFPDLFKPEKRKESE